MADTQKVSPSTVYNVQGSADDYRYILKGADLILVNKQTNESQTFLFVGNIMSLDGKVNMEFSEGDSLQSEDIFNRSEMVDMDKQDEEAPEWQAVSDESTPEGDEGNAEDGNLNGNMLGQLQAAQAALLTDPNANTLSSQQRMFDDIAKFAQQDSLSSDVSKDSGKKLDSKDGDQPEEDKKDEEKKEEPEEKKEEPKDDTGDKPITEPVIDPEPEKEKKDEGEKETTETDKEYGKVTIKLSQESESGIKNEDYDPTAEEGTAASNEFDDDGITNKTNLKIVGTADANIELDIYMDGSKVGSVTTDEDDGSFTFNYSVAGKDDGEHVFQAQVVDSTLEEPKQSNKLELEIDTTDPESVEATVKETSDEDIALDIDKDKIYTNQTTPTLKGTGEANTILTIEYTNEDGSDTGTIENITVNANKSWSYELTDENKLSEGKYTFTITGEDFAGNKIADPTTIENVIVKTTFAPKATISLDTTTDSTGTHREAQANDRITKDDDIDLNISITDTSTRQVTVFIYNNDGPNKKLGNADFDEVSGKWTYTVKEEDIPDDDTYKFIVEAKDLAGNTYTPPLSFLDVTIDRTVTPVQGGLDFNLDAASDSEDSRELLGRDGADSDADRYTHGAEAGTVGIQKGFLKFNGTNAGADGRIDLYLINSDGTKTPLNTDGFIEADGDGNWSYDKFDASSYGTDKEVELTFRAEITDVAGNVESKEIKVTVDNADPVQSSIEVENALETTHNDKGYHTSVTGEDVTLSGIIAESGNDVIVTLYKCDAEGENPELVTFSKEAGTGLSIVADGDAYKWSFEVEGVVHNDKYSYYVTVEDAAGNMSKSEVMTFTSDQNTGKPAITLDTSTDTSTKGDHITDFVTTDEGGTPTENHDIKLKLSADEDAGLKVYQVVDADPSDPSIVLVDADNNIYGKLVNTAGDLADGDTVTFSADGYDNTETELKFVTVATDEAGNTNISDTYTMILDDKGPQDTGSIALSSIDKEGATVNYASGDDSNATKLTLSGSFTDGINTSVSVSKPVVRVYDKGGQIGTATVTGDAASGYTWTYDVNDISETDHSFKIEIEDAAGNTTTVPSDGTTVDINIDRTPPVIDASLAGDLDTGLSDASLLSAAQNAAYADDWITSVDDQDIQIDVAINELGTIVVDVDGHEISHTITADEVTAGKATINLTSELAKDSYSLKVGADTSNSIDITVTDTAGNKSQLSETLVIDNEVKTGAINFADGSNTGDLDDTITTVTKPTLKGKTEPNSKVELRIIKVDSDGNPVLDNGNPVVAFTAAIIAGNDGNWEIPTTTALASGEYSVTATITDIAGNTDTASMPLTITAKPSTPEITMSDDTVPLLFTPSDPAISLDTDGVTSDDKPKFVVTKDAGTTLTMTYWKLDAAGNKIESSKTTVTYDSDAEKAADSIDTGELTDAGGNPVLLNGEDYTFEFISSDDAGNSSDSVTKNVSIDTEYNADDLTLEYKVDNAAVTPGADGTILTKIDSPAINGDAEEGSQVRMMVLKYNSIADLNANGPDLSTAENLQNFLNEGTNLETLRSGLVSVENGKWTASPAFGTEPEDVYYRVVIVSEDQAGNLSAETIDFHHDNQPPAAPEIIMTPDDSNTSITGDALNSVTDLSPRFLVDFADADETVITITKDDGTTISIDASELTETVTVDGEEKYVIQFGSDAANSYLAANEKFLKGGTYTATITSKDDAGNISSDKFDFEIKQEIVAPELKLLNTDITGADTGNSNEAYTSLQFIAEKEFGEGANVSQARELTMTGSAMATYEVVLKEVITAADGTKSYVEIGKTSAGENGVWEITFPDGQNPSEGDHVYIVECDGKSSDPYTVHIDNTTVDPTIDLKTDSGTDGDWLTNNPTLTGAVEKGSTVEIKATRIYALNAEGKYIDENGDPQNVPGDGTISADGKYYVSEEKYSYTVSSDNTADGRYTNDILNISEHSQLADGKYQITVTTTDKAGNVSESVNQILDLDKSTDKPTLELNAESDSFFSTGKLVLKGDSGNFDVLDDFKLISDDYKTKLETTFQEDKLTNDRTPNLHGTAEANATISIAIQTGGSTHTYTTQADVNGDWNLDLGSEPPLAGKLPLPDGEHTITVTATDGAGNHKTSDSLTLTVDGRLSRTADIEIYDDLDGHGVYGNSNIFYTAKEDSRVHLHGENGAAYVLYRLEADGTYHNVQSGFLGTHGADYTVKDSDYPATALDDGAHELNFKLVTIDEAGNYQTSNFTLDVDTLAPSPATQIGFTTKDTADNLIDHSEVVPDTKEVTIHTNNNTTDLIVTLSADTSRVELWEKGGSSALVTNSGITGSQTTLDITDLTSNILKEGTTEYILKFYDDVGNHSEGNDVDVNVIVDTQPMIPKIEITNESDRGFNEEPDGVVLTSGEIFTFTGIFEETGEGSFDKDKAGYQITVTHENGTEWTYNSEGTGSHDGGPDIDFNFNADNSGKYTLTMSDDTFIDGDYTIKIAAIDSSGNISDPKGLTFEIDNNTLDIPTITAEEKFGGEAIKFSMDSAYSHDESPDYDYSDYKSEITIHTSGADTSETITAPLKSDGTISSYLHEITDNDEYAEIKIVDKAGNESESYVYDLNDDNLNYTADFGDTAGIKTYTATLTNTDTHVSQNFEISNDWNASFSDALKDESGLLKGGDYTLTIQGKDDGGDLIGDTKSFDFSLEDLLPADNSNEISFTTDDAQDFNGTKEGAGGSDADNAPADAPIISVEINQNHIEFDIA
ncbi:Ig-like domain-containing protein [Maridesulfovibrio sp.]|uniref:Ig-like domain-containing protein n=1 Tax=unclassified Maridesulfovibrio TaxID=2794999 RepID=UPI003AFF95A8